MFFLNPCEPQAAVSLNLFDSISDDTATAFLKYNAHQHNPVVVPAFSAHGIKIGDSVYLYQRDGTPLFDLTEPPVVDYMTDTQIRITKSSSQMLENGILYYQDYFGQQNSKAIPGVSIDANSQLVYFSPNPVVYGNEYVNGRSGVITPAQAAQLSKTTLVTSFTTVPTQAQYCLLPLLGFNAWLLEVGLVSKLASSSVAVKAYDPDNVEHIYDDTETWQQVGPSFALSSLTRTTSVCFKEEEAISGDYPLDRATAPLSSRVVLSIFFDTAPIVTERVTVSLIFQKVINSWV